MSDATTATETKKGYNPNTRRMAYLRWRVDNKKALTPEQQRELDAYEATHPRRGATEEKPVGPTEAQLRVREQLAQATKTDIKKTSKADLATMVQDAGYTVAEDATKADLLEAAGLPRDWAKS